MTELVAYQADLLSALRPVVEQLDSRLVKPTSSLRVDEGVVELTVEPPGDRVPGLYVQAAASHCTVGIAEGEVLEWHGRPDQADGLAACVLELVTKYLSGVTMVERYNRFDRLLRTEYYYGPGEEPSLACQLGRSTHPFVLPRGVHRTVTRRFRFL